MTENFKKWLFQKGLYKYNRVIQGMLFGKATLSDCIKFLSKNNMFTYSEKDRNEYLKEWKMI